MTIAKVLMRSVGVAAVLAAAGIPHASAQQMIAPASATPTPGPMPDILQKYAPVTAERLKKPEDGNWLMFRRTYDGWGYSPLDEITPENVGRLQPVWSFATGQIEGHQAPPIVNNGVMFVATPGNQVLALEAKTGKVLWRYKRPFPEDMVPLHPTNRGVGALRRQGLFRGGGGGAGRARRQDRQGGLDREGRRLQEGLLHVAGAARRRRQGAARRLGRRVGRARLRRRLRCRDRQGAVEDLHGAGARRARQRNLAGGRRSLQARRRLDLGDRHLRSRDQPHLLGHRQRRARGSATSGRATISTRPRSSPSTPPPAQIKGHFQYHPNDSWDWDEVSPPIVVDYQRDGRTVKGLVNVARNGYLWQLERTNGQDQLRRRPALSCGRTSSRASIPRPGGRTSTRRASRHRQDRRVLPQPVGRQGLAAGRLQPADAADVHPGQREPVHRADRRAGRNTCRASATWAWRRTS